MGENLWLTPKLTLSGLCAFSFIETGGLVLSSMHPAAAGWSTRKGSVHAHAVSFTRVELDGDAYRAARDWCRFRAPMGFVRQARTVCARVPRAQSRGQGA